MKRDAFFLPKGIYLDGNSLGPLSYAAQAAIERRLKQWQYKGVSAWEEWFELAERLSPALAKLVGAKSREVITMGTITSNLHSLLATFYKPTKDRKNILATSLDFPSDVYAMQSWVNREGGELKYIPSQDGHMIAREDILNCLTEDIAVAVLPTVLYRSGQVLDIKMITRAAHDNGIVMGWDAAHSIGALPHSLHEDNVDFAVWCTYKYLNAGPGAPGGLFIHEKHHHLTPGLAGWWGNNKATQFEMTHQFRSAGHAGAQQLGTPPILSLAGLEGALAIFEEVTIEAIRKRSLELTQYFIGLADKYLPEFTLRTPRAAEVRGGHIVLEHPDAQLLSVALRHRDIIPDYRPPNLLRLAPVALYNTETEIDKTIEVLRELLDTESYKDADKDAVKVT